MRGILFFLLLIFGHQLMQAQNKTVTVSGLVRDKESKQGISLINIVLKQEKDSAFAGATITDESGRFLLSEINPGNYLLEISGIGYVMRVLKVHAGTLNAFLDLGITELDIETQSLREVFVDGIRQSVVSEKMDKKVYSVSNNISQSGGSLLQAMKNLPGITVDPTGKLQLRGSDKVAILLDGKQTALTGFGNQTGLDNIPASAIERIEVINNPSARYDANGNAGVINIIFKKSRQEGLNGKISVTAGLGALWEKKGNLPSIRPQYSRTPKINPGLSVNYRKNNLNVFLQGDWLYTKTLNKNEFIDREYSNGDFIRHQVKRNRITTFGSVKGGFDWSPSARNNFSLSALGSREVINDYGDIPYFNKDETVRKRLWQFFEDEVLSAVTLSGSWLHKFVQPGHQLTVSVNYTFNREDEKYFLTNIMPAYTGKDTFMLIADQHVTDILLDYVRPLKRGRLETGAKFRHRYIPTNMRFLPGLNSPLDVNAGGWANYREAIPAAYGNYIFETENMDVEAGIRLEYVGLNYTVNPDHNTYKSDGYSYVQPFPSVRWGYKLKDNQKLTLYYNRRVDRPDEGDIRIFPKYDDPEILKVGNPVLSPQFAQTIEAGYKISGDKGSLYAALYYRTIKNSITRIGTIVPGDPIVYSIFQNAGKSFNYGVEAILQYAAGKRINLNVNMNAFRSTIDAFTVENKYPVANTFTSAKQSVVSGNVKMNILIRLPDLPEVQISAIYLAPDIIPQGSIKSRFSLDIGVKKQWEKSELFANATDLLNTYVIRKEITGSGFRLVSADYYETQVFRIGYSYKF